MNKLLCTDFDGTLLTSDKKVSPHTMESLHALIEQNNYVAYTTGRPLSGALRLIDSLSLPKKRAFLLCFQGNLIYDLEKGKQLHDAPMRPENAKRLIAELEALGMYLEVFGRDCFYIKEETEATRRYRGISAQENDQMVTDWSVVEHEPIYKVMAIDFDHPENLKELARRANEEESFPFDHFYSSPWFYEYCEKGKNKGQGVKDLARILGISRENVVAVGDEENDLSMIHAAGIGVLMQNAREEIKREADYITTSDNDHDGVAEVIHRYLR